MGSMQRSTFHASPASRSRRRQDGPALHLVQGTGGAPRTTTGVIRRAHPAFEGFIPDGLPSTHPGKAVQGSGPDASPSCRMSRGTATPDTEEATHSGPGPIISRTVVVRLLGDYLESTAGEVRPPSGDVALRSIR
jgi:hypothetical protein